MARGAQPREGAQSLALRAALPFALALSCVAQPARAGEGIPWARDPVQAFVQAGERRGAVMILFIGPDCGPKAVPGEIARGGRGITKDFLNKCELMEQDVLSRPDVVAAAARLQPLLVEQGLTPKTAEDDLERRFRVVTIPTVLFADPWGNEIVRLVGLVPHDKFLGVVKAMPSDFAAMEQAGRLLREDADNASAMVSAAGFYSERGLQPISELLYERALGTKALKGDAAARREVALARGTNLLGMNKPSEAAKVFEKAVSDAPDGPQGDALLFGWLAAELHAGRTKEARKVFAGLEKRFPASPYTVKARQALESAGTEPKR